MKITDKLVITLNLSIGNIAVSRISQNLKTLLDSEFAVAKTKQ